MQRVPVQAVSNQTFAVTVARQSCQIVLRQMNGSIFFSLMNNRVPIVTGRICRDRQRILLDARYKPFIGDFAFVDTQGTSDPLFTGLGTRFVLYYLAAGE